MKLKYFIASALLTVSLSASAFETAENILSGGLDITENIVSGGLDLSENVVSGGLDISENIVSSSLELKEQVKASKGDAVDFLAGEKASELLVNTINALRENDSRLEQNTDKEIAAAIASI